MASKITVETYSRVTPTWRVNCTGPYGTVAFAHIQRDPHRGYIVYRCGGGGCAEHATWIGGLNHIRAMITGARPLC